MWLKCVSTCGLSQLPSLVGQLIVSCFARLRSRQLFWNGSSTGSHQVFVFRPSESLSGAIRGVQVQQQHIEHSIFHFAIWVSLSHSISLVTPSFMMCRFGMIWPLETLEQFEPNLNHSFPSFHVLTRDSGPQTCGGKPENQQTKLTLPLAESVHHMIDIFMI